MAAAKTMILALYLSLMICASVSQRFRGYGGQRHNPGARLTQYCGLFNYEKFDEGYRCNWDVLKEVYDADRKIHRDGYMGQLFRWARHGMLCYSEGTHVLEVRGPCDAMELACRHNTPKVIDNCWRVAPANPPAGPPVNPRPNPPPGRGI